MSELRNGIARAVCGPLETGADGSLCQRFKFEHDFQGFAGHFPGYPLLPGVVQLLIAQTLVETALGRRQVLAEVVGAKFLEQLLPGREIVVQCRTRDADRQAWNARLEVEGRLAASFQLHFRPAAT
ncbi:hypothetical protein JCM30471_06280 [Desulfuromonas carbonis]